MASHPRRGGVGSEYDVVGAGMGKLREAKAGMRCLIDLR